ncbi:PREDICTED: uncharacterized protein LOC106299306 [Brassica oleracea var. oleracea]|uniref:uncharacterized protein LOC106299306 n=1 Tax=Brassica oleracea var. oleracea TaxID=109376 RepID=UPI0006A6BAB4|nr:PREDICTED: uncharacterized protein LOC106299306 [Brassica oleracea var. oleracea]
MFFILIVAASSIGEELFYRVAVQGALSDMFLRGTQLMTDSRGMASLTGVFPPFVPFSQAFAAVITATLTGSLYFLAASPKDPIYIVAPVLRSRRDDFKKLLSGTSYFSFLLRIILFLRYRDLRSDIVLLKIVSVK